MTEYAEKLANGSSLSIGGIHFDDAGVTLNRKKFFGSDEVYTPWGQVKFFSSNGCLVIADKTDPKVSAAASYKDAWNTHILEAMIRFSFKNWKGRLSGIIA